MPAKRRWALPPTEPQVLFWLSPVLTGSVLAPVLSRLTSETRAGAALRDLGHRRTAEELLSPSLASAAALAAAQIAVASARGLADLIDDGALVESHVTMIGGVEATDHETRLARIAAAAQIAAAADSTEALRWLDARERLALAEFPALLAQWAGAPPTIAHAAEQHQRLQSA